MKVNHTVKSLTGITEGAAREVFSMMDFPGGFEALLQHEERIGRRKTRSTSNDMWISRGTLTSFFTHGLGPVSTRTFKEFVETYNERNARGCTGNQPKACPAEPDSRAYKVTVTSIRGDNWFRRARQEAPSGVLIREFD